MNDELHQKFMQRAIELSRDNVTRCNGGPFGAVIVKDGHVIGEGWNQVTASNDPTAHAEVEAIRNACTNLQVFDLSGADIYTSCEPCPMCLAAIYWARLRTIYYCNTKEDAASIEFDDDFIYKEFAKEPSHRAIPMQRIHNHEGMQVFAQWKAQDGRIRY